MFLLLNIAIQSLLWLESSVFKTVRYFTEEKAWAVRALFLENLITVVAFSQGIFKKEEKRFRIRNSKWVWRLTVLHRAVGDAKCKTSAN